MVLKRAITMGNGDNYITKTRKGALMYGPMMIMSHEYENQGSTSKILK